MYSPNTRKLLSRIHKVLVAALAFFPALAQKPVINPQGIVNAASFAGDPNRGAVLAHGIATIFGSNLASSTQQASSTPLPTDLGGTSVMVAGTLAPLFYVSPNQINFQIPSRLQDVSSYPKLRLVVTTAKGASDPVEVTDVDDAPGIFTLNGSGCGPGAVQNANADGSVTLNSQQQSASPDSYITVYATGMAGVLFPPADGWPATTNPLSIMIPNGGGLLGFDGFKQWHLNKIFSGLAPGLVGVYQMNLYLPDSVPEGCAVPLKLSAGSTVSQPVTISIHRGGGQCQDPSKARFASINWNRTVTSGPSLSDSSTTDTFAASFASAPENLVTELTTPAPGHQSGAGFIDFPGPRCSGTAPHGLDAGPIRIEGLASGPLTVNPSSLSGETLYKATLPAGSIQPGQISLAAAGGVDVDRFQTAISLPPSIQITTPLSPGTVFSQAAPLKITWSGGTADQIVRLQLIHSYPGGHQEYFEVAALASDGSATIPVLEVYRNQLPLPPGNNDVVIIVSALQPATFTAPNLTRPAIHNWTYEYHFAGMTFK